MAQQKRTAWKDTQASQVQPTIGNFVKLENLLECKVTIQDVIFEPSEFDPKKERVRVVITYDDDEGTELAGMEFQFTTEQTRIMQRMSKLSPEELPVGPVSVFTVGKPNKYGNQAYDIGEPVDDIDALPAPRAVSNPANVVNEAVSALDKIPGMHAAAPQRQAGQSLRSKSVR